MRAVIHIGTPKTGTTSIQNLLLSNYEWLRCRGCLYPRCLAPARRSPQGLPADHNVLMRCLAWGHPMDLQTPLRRELAQSGCSRLLLSSEGLAAYMQTAEQVQRLRDFLHGLGCDSFSIVIWLREPGALFASLCSQQLRIGDPKHMHFLTPPASPRLRGFMDNRALLQRWGGVFGREALVVRLFEPECFVQGDLLHDAMAAFDLKWDAGLSEPPRVNESLNLLEMQLLGVLNHLLQGRCNYSHTPKALIFEVLHRHAGELGGPQLRFVPPRQVVQAWRAWAAEGNEWVRQEFFPARRTLFAPPREQKENYELQMTPGCWEALGRVLAELGAENFRLRRERQDLIHPAARTEGEL